jgi:hypothetical protein
MNASRAPFLRCCKVLSNHDLHQDAKAAADPGSEGPQSKRSLTTFHRDGLLIGCYERQPSAPASLNPVTVRTFLVYPFPLRTFFIYSAHTRSSHVFLTQVTRCSICQPHHASGYFSRGIEPLWLFSCYQRDPKVSP